MNVASYPPIAEAIFENSRMFSLSKARMIWTTMIFGVLLVPDLNVNTTPGDEASLTLWFYSSGSGKLLSILNTHAATRNPNIGRCAICTWKPSGTASNRSGNP